MEATPVPTASASATALDCTGFHEDLRLQTWVHSVLGPQVATTPQPPGGHMPEGRCIGLYLWALAPSMSARSNAAAPLQFSLRYLITAWSPEPEEAHADLCELAFAALDAPEFEVDLEPPAPAVWAAFGTPPRPALGLRLSLQRARVPNSRAPMVRSPLMLASVPMVALQGRVLGPGGVAVAAARVELARLGRVAQTGPTGQFRFAAVPAGPLELRVLARGQAQTFQVNTALEQSTHQPLQLDMNFI
jgi:hypothetical protein